MLDFLTKLIKRKPDANKIAFATNNSKQIEKDRQILKDKKDQLEDKRKNTEQERLHFLKKIADVAHVEAALIELVTHCDFAEGRLQAAQHVYSKHGLETIKNALRNTDKRVVKLMQSRLDSIQKTEQEYSFARACITSAEQLLKQDHLILNQIIDLDKQVATLKNFPEELASQFAQVRQQLAQQLDVQQNLQRSLLNITQAPNWVMDDSFIEKKAEFEQQLQSWESELNAVLAHEKSHSVPKHLIQEVRQKLQTQAQKLKLIAPQKSVSQIMARKSVESVESEIVLQSTSSESSQVYLDNSEYPEHIKQNKKHQLSSTLIEKLLSQLEAAIEQGSIQNSRQFEIELRDVKLDNTQLTKSQKNRLHQARYAFSELQSLAKWSADVSRHELITTAEGLANLSVNLSAQELVTTVSALRKQWKQLEQTSGGSSKEMWNQFDIACNNAYAPAAQHFQELDEQRQVNLDNAEKFLVAMQIQVQALLNIASKTEIEEAEITNALNWKKIYHAISQFQQDWKKLGLVDRQHINRITTQFEKTLNSLREPLAKRQQEEIHAREQLIAQALKIDASQRQAIEQVRTLQERWQAHAQQVPLRRQDEQALWDQFRSACDAVFVQRKQVAESNDAQRLDNLKLKTALCERLEAVSPEDTSTLNQTLSAVAKEWKEIGFTPREHDAVIERRYQSAVQAVQTQIKDAKQKEQQLHSEHLMRKIALCQELEKLLINVNGQEGTHHTSLEKMVREWEQMSSLENKDKWTLILNTRFAAAKSVLENQYAECAKYTAQLRHNLPLFDDTLLHAEILASVESPAELASQRLQKQVAVLQASMKSRQSTEPLADVMSQLIAMPVLLDAARQQRLSTVFGLGL